MMVEKFHGKAEVISSDHPISVLTLDLIELAETMAVERDMSRWNVCEAMANGCGFILAAGEDMPREAAVIRIDDLRKIMGGAYDLYGVEGEG